MKIEDVALLGVVGFAAFKFLDGRRALANTGSLDVEPASGAQNLAPISGIAGRDPNVSCAIEPPQMISTSLLPADNQPMSDSDFVGITPEKLQQVNFLASGWALGRDTQTNTLRNPSYDLRSEPSNPQTLHPANNSFLNSTIGQPEFQRSFEMDAVSDTSM